MANIKLNGQDAEFAPGETLRGFLRARSLDGDNLILEWNGKILTGKDPLETFKLQDEDTLNLFSMVGGG